MDLMTAATSSIIKTRGIGRAKPIPSLLQVVSEGSLM